MMRSRSTLGIALVTILAAACGPDQSSFPGTEPSSSGGPLIVISPVNAYCDVATPAEIQADINALFVGGGWPDANSALGKFDEIQRLQAAGNSLSAKRKTFDLARFILKKFEKLPAAQKAAVDAQTKALVADLYCFVGLSGAVFDLKPNDPAKAFVGNVGPEGEKGGVYFPPNAVQEGTLITITVIPNGDPLDTPLDKYPTYLEVEKYPDLPLNLANGKPVVGVCIPGNTPLGVLDRLLLGHQRFGPLQEGVPEVDLGFELLARQTIPEALTSLLGCPLITSQGPETAPKTWLGRMMHRVADFVLPPEVQAAPMFAFGGVGGSPEEFSPFGAVDPYLSAFGGVGGSPEEFAPMMPGPMMMVSPVPTIEGYVGTTTTTNVPNVTIKTEGNPTPNPIPGVAVTFSVSGTATFCGAATAVTDAAGFAKLPCLNFGPTPGSSTITATFSTSSLNFPGSDLVVVNDGQPLTWTVTSLTPLPVTVVNFRSGGYDFLGNVGASPPTGWNLPSFTPGAGWVTGASAAFGSTETSGCTIFTSAPKVTLWPVNTNILVRKQFTTSYAGTLTITLYIDNDAQVWLDGQNITASGVASNGNWTVQLNGAGTADDFGRHENCADNGNPVFTLNNVAAGNHTLAIYGVDRGGAAYLDMKVDLAPAP